MLCHDCAVTLSRGRTVALYIAAYVIAAALVFWLDVLWVGDRWQTAAMFAALLIAVWAILDIVGPGVRGLRKRLSR